VTKLTKFQSWIWWFSEVEVLQTDVERMAWVFPYSSSMQQDVLYLTHLWKEKKKKKERDD
jgi:hypothetical protein